MNDAISLSELIGTTALVAVLQSLLFLWLGERFKTALKEQADAKLEALKWEMKVREQAAKMAEYMSLARDLREDSSVDDFRKANRLAWEVAMWLPDDIYRDLQPALLAPTDDANPLTIVIKVRQLLLGDKAGALTSHDIVVHGPGIGRFMEAQPAITTPLTPPAC